MANIVGGIAAWFNDTFFNPLKGDDGEVVARQSLWTRANNRGVVATPADFLGAFNPLGLPLLPWNEVIEINESNFTEDYPFGAYFINDNIIQFRAAFLQESPFYRAKIYKNNLLLASENQGIKANIDNGTYPIDLPPFTDVFLGVH